ncbi:uncharacterized protein LOC144432465 [Styela clava]
MDYYTIYLTIELIECRLQNKIEEQSIEWEGPRTGSALESTLTVPNTVMICQGMQCEDLCCVIKVTSRNSLLKNDLMSPDGVLAWKHI